MQETKSEEKKKEEKIEVPQPMDLTIDLPDERMRPKSVNTTDDVELCFDERDAKKVSNITSFL